MATRSSGDLLDIIARMLGTDVETFLALKDGHAKPTDIARSADAHSAMLLVRMARAFHALPDHESRWRALQYVEALAVSPKRKDS